MNKLTPKKLFLCVMLSSPFMAFAETILTPTVTDFNWKFSGSFRPEMLYGRNVSLLNNRVETDKQWFMRHIFDLNFDLTYGQLTYEKEIAKFYTTMRNKAIWGNPNSILSTTSATIKDVNSVVGDHSHNVPRHLLWIRELWFKFNILKAMGLSFTNEHTLTLGAFPFELGRGIALGDAYAVGPELLGYYFEGAVDQYAYGAKLSGDILPDVLSYDFYTAILNNKSSTLGDTGEKIRGQELGRFLNPVRGFGVISFVVAGRLNWTVFESVRFGTLTLEPYGLYNNDPEQSVALLGDSSSRLGTVGLASEYKGSRFELGFDYAQNFGRQLVKGIDRNKVERRNLNGALVELNSEVLVGSADSKTKALFIPGSDSQNLIIASRAPEQLSVDLEPQNGKSIGISSTPQNLGTLFNSKTRFRDSFTNTYEGWMFVIDALLWLYKKDLYFSATAGVSSGDDNPNEETIDGVYSGFIPLQELYSGKRVRSSFLLGGKVKRPLAIPEDEQAPSPFASNVSGFTNIVFCGAALNYKPQDVPKQYNINPNLLAFWQQKATKKFDIISGKNSKDDARNFLGIEANVFFNYFLLKDLRLFLVSAVFFPGTHYQDIRGLPLNAAQLAALSELDTTGFTNEQVPNIGTDVAYSFNLGIEFKF